MHVALGEFYAQFFLLSLNVTLRQSWNLFFPTGSESWLHKSCLVNDVGPQLSSLPEVRQRQQHYGLLGLMQIWKEGLCICHLVSNWIVIFTSASPCWAQFQLESEHQVTAVRIAIEGEEVLMLPSCKVIRKRTWIHLGTGLSRVCWWGVSGHHWKCLRPKNRQRVPACLVTRSALVPQLWTEGSSYHCVWFVNHKVYKEQKSWQSLGRVAHFSSILTER